MLNRITIGGFSVALRSLPRPAVAIRRRRRITPLVAEARTAVLEQATESPFAPGSGCRAVPRRHQVQGADVPGWWALDGVLEYLEHASILRWDGDELIASTPGDRPRHFLIQRPTPLPAPGGPR
jgi:hypothetical protein